MCQKEHNIGRKEEHVYVHPTIVVGKLQLNQSNKYTNYHEIINPKSVNVT